MVLSIVSSGVNIALFTTYCTVDLFGPGGVSRLGLVGVGTFARICLGLSPSQSLIVHVPAGRSGVG